MPRARYRALPDAPGVYGLLRSNGDVLYVGKAKSIRKRVASHLGKPSGATERALEMLTQVDDIAFEVTATALEATVLESGLIKRLTFGCARVAPASSSRSRASASRRREAAKGGGDLADRSGLAGAKLQWGHTP